MYNDERGAKMTLLIELDDNNLVEQAQDIGHHKTKSEAVEAALRAYIELQKQTQILNLFGTIDYDSDHDYKTQRRLS
jgi:metal-responsive CopG/Arc/MetJ family transcriptional regulator